MQSYFSKSTCCFPFQQNKRVAEQKQVTITTFCMHTFQTALNHLQAIYSSSKLVSKHHPYIIIIIHVMNFLKRQLNLLQNEINMCLLILNEVTDLICMDTPSGRHVDHNIYTLLEELGMFLKYIRQSTSHGLISNKYHTNRNNCIVLLFIMCRLVMHQNDTEAQNMSDSIDRKKIVGNVSQRSNMTACSDTVLAERQPHKTESVWHTEMELAMLDYPLKHFYPDVHELLLITLRVDEFVKTSSVRVLLNADKTLESAVRLLKDNGSLKGKDLIVEGLKSFEVFSIIQSSDLVAKLFNEITM